jgi:hypothetical protein
MTNNEIKEIFLRNSDEKLSEYLAILLAKCQAISRESNLIAIFMLLLILLYYMAGFSQLESLQIGPIGIKDINSIKIFIPLVFAFLILRFTLLSTNKAELQRIIKKFSSEYFSFKDPLSEDILHMDDFTRSILPFSLYDELGKLTNKGKKTRLGCIGLILIVPISTISVIPLILEYYWIKDFIMNFDNLNFTQKSSIVLSIWILVISIYYLLCMMIIGVKENK